MGGRDHVERFERLVEPGAWPRGPLPVHDARSVPDGTVLEYDVCVVGTGAAGATAALALVGRGLRIAVVEGGGVVPDEVSTAFTAVESIGLPGVTADSRERWLGGTTNAWTGGKTTLDPIDLRTRDWVPDSGWPLGWDELRRAYERAAALLGLPGPEAYDEPAFGPAAAADGIVFGSQGSGGATAGNGAVGSEGSGDRLRTLVFHNDAHPLRYGRMLRDRVGPGDGVDLWTLANVTEVELDESGERVGGVALATLRGNRFRIRARVVALACGAIENARLLLASRSARPAGLGNGHDLVGRYYQDHPKGFTGVIAVEPTARRLPASTYWPGRPSPGGSWRWGVGLSEPEQERVRVLNSYVRLEPVVLATVPPATAALRRLPRDLARGRVRQADPRPLADLPSELPALARLARFRIRNGGPIDAIRVRSFLEQQPVRSNRVRLADRRDPLGLPLAAVDSRLTDLDRETVAVVHRALAEAVRAHGLGELHAHLDGHAVWEEMAGASHHAGTTRMGTDPHRSVAGPDGQVHDVPGLFVLGASLFPTSGYANPVFTIAATSLLVADRIADHMAARPVAVATGAVGATAADAEGKAQPADGVRRAVTGAVEQVRHLAGSRPTSGGRAEVVRWARARQRARRLRPPAASRAAAVVWTLRERAELLPVEVPDPGQGELSVLVEASAVSAGTERARWLGLPGAPVRYPHHPGYSLAGTVRAVGPGVHDLEPGARVAVWGAPHQSLVTVSRAQVHPLGAGTDAAAASLVTLGAIAAFGVARAGGVGGRSLAVVGAGAIGLLAQRLAGAAGAGPCTVVAASNAKDAIALGDPAVKLARPAEVEGVAADVVVEASGTGDGLDLAVRAAAPGGTVVLLGTTRADAVAVRLDLVQARGLRLVGAHAGLLDRPGGTDGLDRRSAAAAFVDSLEQGTLRVDDLVSAHVDPAHVAALYDRLATDRTLVTPVLDWWRLPADVRAAPGALTVPNPFRRGLRPTGGDREAPRPANAPAPAEIVDHAAPAPVPYATPPALGPDDAAVHAAAVAAAAVAAATQAPRGPIEVAGDGTLADQVRTALGGGGEGSGAPAVVVVAEPDEASVRAGLDALTPGGTLVLAGAVCPVDLDVQNLVHKRGVTVVGVPPPAAAGAA
jgi:2-desacetyl-2-hydroxyethyl bacteriochlorophyllide A dehydrogenase